MKNSIPFPIKKVTVLLTYGTDQITLTLDGPTPFPEMKYELQARIEARQGYGAQWVRENLGVEPKIIETRGEMLPDTKKKPPSIDDVINTLTKAVKVK